MLESWLATISTLLDVMGIQVELSSPDRQLEIALITIKVTVHQVHDNINTENLSILKNICLKSPDKTFLQDADLENVLTLSGCPVSC